MKELFIYMVDVMTIPEIISKIKTDIAAYEASPTEENLKALEFSTCMFTTKGSLRQQKPEQLIDKMEKNAQRSGISYSETELNKKPR